MRRVRHLVAYDIRDPVRLRRVHKIVKGFGDSMQYSVFVCDLTVAERAALMQRLIDAMDTAADRVALVELGDPRDERPFIFVGNRPRLPAEGPLVF